MIVGDAKGMIRFIGAKAFIDRDSEGKPINVIGMNWDRSKEQATILLAEDNKMYQKVCAMMLKKLGYECDIANDGLEAVAMIEKNSYSLVLMDIQMPNMD